jgi:hypothetical protein
LSQSFIETNSESRFTDIETNFSITTYNRVGFKKKKINEKGETVYWHYVFPEAFKTQLCSSYPPTLVLKTLKEEGWLELESSGKSSKREYLPGIGRTRVYVFNSKMWEA